MRKIILVGVLALSATAALAHPPHGYWRHGGSDRWFWMAPLIVGGAVVYEATRPAVVVQQQPVMVYPPEGIPTVQQQNCSPWTEIQNSDGTVTRTRTCTR